MPKPAMLSGTMKSARLPRRKTQEPGIVSKDVATESLFLTKLSSSNVKAVALTRAPEN